MSPVLSLLLSLVSCTLLWGMLLPPRDVRLEAQNFHVFLRWQPDPGTPSGATYQVEWRKWYHTSHWTKADACWGSSTSSNWTCELYFDQIHDFYWARVRAVARGKLSKWASSSELQPYRDTIVGPPRLSWLLQGDVLSVNITMPLTPFQRKNDSYKPVNQVLRKLWYRLDLYEGDVLVQQVPCKRSRKAAPCTFKFLKPSTQYCIRTVAVDVAREQSRETEQCMVTQAGPAGFPWVVFIVPIGVFLVSVAGLWLLQLHIFPSPSETRLPKVLAVLNREMSVPILQLEENSLTLLLLAVLPSHRPPTAGQTTPPAQLLLRESLSQDTRGYCANGFGPGCHEGGEPSCTLSQMGHAMGSQVSLQPEDDGEADDGCNVLEQLMLVGLTRDSYTGDRDCQAAEMWLSRHLQPYSKCQCPALEAGSRGLPALGRSFSQEDLQESLGPAGHCVPLSSVKLPASEEEGGRQLLCGVQHGCGTEPHPADSTMQDDLELAASGIPLSSPCQPPRLPPKSLWAAALSGYRLRPPVHSET